jgi:hypothetical protein
MVPRKGTTRTRAYGLRFRVQACWGRGGSSWVRVETPQRPRRAHENRVCLKATEPPWIRLSSRSRALGPCVRASGTFISVALYIEIFMHVLVANLVSSNDCITLNCTSHQSTHTKGYLSTSSFISFNFLMNLESCFSTYNMYTRVWAS